jgi:Zn-dependent protease
MDLSPEVLQAIIGKFIILLLSVAVHEFGHAYVADRLGDRLPRQQGRVTLNPLAHADPIGTVALPLFSLIALHGGGMGVGWGKPVQTLPNAYTRRLRMRTGHMFVAFAGPAMNFVFGTLIALVLYGLLVGGVFKYSSFAIENSLPSMMVTAIWTNYVLMFFNLIPAKPLDGGSVLDGLLPDRIRNSSGYEQYMRYSLFVVVAFMMIPTLRAFFVWPATQLLELILRAIGPA